MVTAAGTHLIGALTTTTDDAIGVPVVAVALSLSETEIVAWVEVLAVAGVGVGVEVRLTVHIEANNHHITGDRFLPIDPTVDHALRMSLLGDSGVGRRLTLIEIIRMEELQILIRMKSLKVWVSRSIGG